MKTTRIILAALAAVPVFLSAQTEYFTNEPNGSITAGCAYQMWRTDGDSLGSVSQVSFPVTVTLPLSQAFQLTIVHTPALSKANDLYNLSYRSSAKHDQLKINGLSDTWVQGAYLFPSGAAMVNFGLGLPTGKTGLTNVQFDLAKQLSMNIFRYQVPVYGQGFCGRAGGAAAFPMGRTAVAGIGGQFLYHGKYNPISYSYDYPGRVGTLAPYEPEYKPGNEVTVQAGLDLLLGEKFKLMVDLEVTAYQRDLLDGREVFKSGTRSLASVGMYHEFGQQFIMANVRYRIRGKHEYLDSLALNMQTSTRNLLGNQFEADLVYKAYAFRDGGFFVYGDVRFYDTNENNTDGAMAIGGGVGIQFPLGETTFGDFRIKYLGGNVKNPIARNLFGMDAGFGLKFLL
jgi:hypothetical protein